MTKNYCDKCQKEANDKDFKFEGMIREVKQLLTSGNPRPQLMERLIHLCKKCFEQNLKL